MRHQCFAVCAPGIEHLVVRELRSLGVRRVRPLHGGVTYDATTRQLYASNVWLRTATRVLERVARFRAPDFAHLERAAADIPWDAWLTSDRPASFRVTTTGSRLYHTGAIEERLQRAIGNRDGSTAADPQLMVVRVVRDEVTVSVDTSGQPLYKRGWRQETTRASMRETLAAAMLLEAGWDATQPLLDPFSGSGTIAIEAALLATDRAPGERRDFAFEQWPSFQPGTWASVRSDLVRPSTPKSPTPRIIATDRDEGAVSIAAQNATRAGVTHMIDIRRASVSEMFGPPDIVGWVVTDPPYGRRVSKGADRRDLFARFGDVARMNLAGWNVGLLVDDLRLVGHAHLELSERFRTDNGGIPVRYLTGRV